MQKAGEDGITMRLRVCTWNVGNAPPPNDLSEWLGTDKGSWDIIAVGAQEANFRDMEQSSTPLSEKSGRDSTQKDLIFETPTGKLRKLTTRLRPTKRRSRGSYKPLDEVPVSSSETPGSVRRKQRPAETINTAGINNDIDPDAMKFSPIFDGPDVFQPYSYADKPSIFPFPTTDSSELHTHHQGRLENRLALLDMSKLTPAQEGILVIDTADLDGGSASSEGSASDQQYNSEEEEGEVPFAEENDSHFLFSPVSPENPDPFHEVEMNPFDELVQQERLAAMSLQRKEYDHPSSEPASADDLLHAFSGGQIHYPEPSGPNSLPKSKSAPDSNQNPTKKFSKRIQRAIGNEYLLVAKHHLMEIKLLLFVNRKHEHRIGKTESTSEATGIGNVVGNKGAVAVKLVVNDTSFCFVSSHLAAHEGTKFCQQRNADMQEIMRNLEKSGMSKSSLLPSIHQFCHIIWMGDLNYRLDLERGLPKATMMNHSEKWEYVHDAILRNDIRKLAQYDELRGEIDSMRAFANFSEGAISFLPTFKVARGVPVNQYQRLRIPSYCDRILWHSLPMHKDSIRQIEYSAIESYCTSDHKPVFAVFNVDVPRRMPRSNKRIPKNSLKCTIDFKSLRLSGLYEKKNGTILDDYDVLADGALSLRFDDPIFDSEDRSQQTLSSQCAATPPRSSRSGLLQGLPIDVEGAVVEKTSHTRRGVRVEFLSNGLFAKDKVFRTDVPLKNGVVRECKYDELPAIPLIPMDELNDLMHKYVTIVFTRWGSKIASSCVLPIADMLTKIGEHTLKTKLELTKFGAPIAYVEVEAELCISMETWIDSRNRIIKVRRPKS